MATFDTRAQWGARAPKSASGSITPAQGGVVVHHVDTVRVAGADHADCAAQARGIQNYHMDGNGWSDIAYTISPACTATSSRVAARTSARLPRAPLGAMTTGTRSAP